MAVFDKPGESIWPWIWLLELLIDLFHALRIDTGCDECRAEPLMVGSVSYLKSPASSSFPPSAAGCGGSSDDRVGRSTKPTFLPRTSDLRLRGFEVCPPTPRQRVVKKAWEMSTCLRGGIRHPPFCRTGEQ